MSSSEQLFSIGNVAELTGISADTIRVWERRYGKPRPIRLPSGHRRYNSQHVRWLRRVAEALARGHRPSRVVGLSETAVNRLLDGNDGTAITPELDDILSCLAQFDVDGVRSRFRAFARDHGLRSFLVDIVHPLLHHAGRSWADGNLQLRHEHLMSQLLEDFLRQARADLEPAPAAPIVLLSTMSGERHGLGLQSATIVVLLSGHRPVNLGPDTPIDEIVLSAEECGAQIVAIGVSLATGGVETDRQLAELRSRLPASTRLCIGGQGARGVRRGPRGIEYVQSIDDFFVYLRAHAAEAAPVS